MTASPKITFAQMRASGVRGVLVYSQGDFDHSLADWSPLSLRKGQGTAPLVTKESQHGKADTHNRNSLRR